MSAPRLSVVATSRNDDHGGSLAERTQWFVDGLAVDADRHGLELELVLVEWNPPEGRPPLAETLVPPRSGHGFGLRIITVPREVHRDLAGAQSLPMLQFVAKNVGIRRAAGRFVLATNIDILLSAELAAALVEPFARGCLYRVDRYDVEFPFRDVHDVDEALAFCADHPLRYARRDGVYYASGRELPIYQSVSDFVAYETAHWYTRLRSPRTLSLDAPLRRDRKRLRYGSAAPNERTGRLDPARVKSLGYSILDRADAALSLATLPKLHVNACGDFTLMSRDDWFALRAYPEWIVHSWHLDTLLLHQAHASGLLFIELEPPLVVYHMEHGQGSGWTPEGHAEHFRRVETTGIHTLSSSELRRWKRQLRSERKRGKIVTLNDEDWGLGSASFDEVRLAEP